MSVLLALTQSALILDIPSILGILSYLNTGVNPEKFLRGSGGFALCAVPFVVRLDSGSNIVKQRLPLYPIGPTFLRAIYLLLSQK